MKLLREMLSGIMVILLITSTLSLGFKVQRVEATNNLRPTNNLRLLLNFYYAGELFWGAFSRKDFESYFEYVGYYNTIADFDSWKAFDVICVSFSLDEYTVSLQPEDVAAFRNFLSLGGGLVVLEDFRSNQALQQIHPTLLNDGRIYNVLGGIVVTGVPRLLARAGVFNDNFIKFLDAVATAGTNRVGNRSIAPKEYYGTDVVLHGNRIDMVVEESRASEYEKDIPGLEKAMSNMEQFLGFTIDRRIKVSVRPTALEFGLFASGVTDCYDHIAFARPPGNVRGIFEHECAHIYEHEFNKRYFTLPSFGVGVIGEAASDNPDFSIGRKMIKIQPRAIWIWYALIDMVGPSKMKVFFDSLNQYDKEFIPNESYWDALYMYPEDETEYLRRSSSIINFYFSRAFKQNFVNAIREWGINEVSDWEPIWSKLDEAERIFSTRYPLKNILLKRSDMLRAFYGGEFQRALMLATELLDLFSDKTAPSGSIVINEGDSYTASTSVTLTLTATDDTSGIAYMRFSHDNITWTPWEPYSTSKAWILTTGDGTKTVYVQFMDNAGLISPSYYDTIILDTTKPIANAGQDQTVNVGATVIFDAGLSTDNVGIIGYEWNFGDGTTGTGRTTNHTYTEPGTYTVTLTVKDAAGNSATHQITITVTLRQAVVNVKVVDALGSPVQGAEVSVYYGETLLGRAYTDPSGKIELTVLEKPSYRVMARYGTYQTVAIVEPNKYVEVKLDVAKVLGADISLDELSKLIYPLLVIGLVVVGVVVAVRSVSRLLKRLRRGGFK
jgi:PKD repeat protein